MPVKKQAPAAPTFPDLATLADPDAARALYHKGPTCSVSVALESLPDDQADLLRKALENGNARGVDIADALCGLGFEMNAHTVQRHRRRRCRCER